MRHKNTTTGFIRQKSEILSGGFTLIELMLAMVFVAFILVFMSLTLVQMFRTYDKGNSMKQVNQAGRAIIEDISQAVRSQLPTDIQTGSVAAGVLCINDTMYQWNPLYVDGGAALNTDPTAHTAVTGDPVGGGMMVRKSLTNPSGPAGCSPTAPFDNETMLLSNRARVIKATVTRSGDNNRLVKLSFVIGTYARSEFDPPQPPEKWFTTPSLRADAAHSPTCLPGDDGAYCAFAEFNTVVYLSKDGK